MHQILIAGIASKLTKSWHQWLQAWHSFHHLYRKYPHHLILVLLRWQEFTTQLVAVL